MVRGLRVPPGTVFWCGRSAFFGILVLLGPFGKEFHLGGVTKPRFLRGFGLQEGGPGRKNWHLKIVST